MRSGLLAILSGILFFSSQAQVASNLRVKTIAWEGDSLVVDSLSLVPGSMDIRDNSMNKADSALFRIDYFRSTIYIDKGRKGEALNREFKIYYRTYPFNLSQKFMHKDIKLIEKDQTSVTDPFVYQVQGRKEDFFEVEGLNKSGSISRGISLGNNQDLAVNSNLDLQLSGRISEDVKILAAISDGNIPIQSEGNTQQLQEFDRVFIQLYNDRYKLIAGDYRMQNESRNHFLRYNKSLQGGSAEAIIKSDPLVKSFKREETYYTRINAAVSKGKFAINKIQGSEGNQGPYLLRGAENESFIVVISGTEKVYIDGKLLNRGQNYDYLIDYNTAEITFTPNQIITKDKRITVEFQYSDRSYARRLFHVRSGYENKKWDFEVNYYNEGDDKNQSLDRELSDADKKVLSDIGDSLNQALVPSARIDTAADLSSEILYKLIRQTAPFGPDSFFVYSTDADSAIWRVTFAFAGEGKGDYLLASSAANGKVYQFVPRDSVTGMPAGKYLPLTVLASPKRRQLLTAGGGYRFTKHSRITAEAAFSNNDINTFSSTDNSDNEGAAIFVRQDNSLPLGPDSGGIALDAGIGYEHVNRDFKQIERFRSVEFYRDWNLAQPLDVPEGSRYEQDLAEAYLGISKKEVGMLRYTFSTFREEDTYNGRNNKLNASFNNGGFRASASGSYLTSRGKGQSSEFLRYNGLVSQQISLVRVGVEADEEHSRILDSGDSLQASSFRWDWWQAFIENADTSAVLYRLSYRNRYDYLPGPEGKSLSRATFAEDLGFDMSIGSSQHHQVVVRAIYRKLQVENSDIYTNGPEENILGKVDYQALFLRRMLTWQTYYEIGSGLEIKREVVFQGPLNPGQGRFVWKDLNDDGVEQKNEFFEAPTPQEGLYERILLPTNEYQRAYTNIFNQMIFLKPEVLLSSAKSPLKVLSYISDRMAYRIDKKSNGDNIYNPLSFNFDSDSLLSLNYSVLNTIYINRLGTVFGIELNYRENSYRNFFVSGKETRAQLGRGIRTRWNITQLFTLNTEYERGRNEASSENFTDRDFDITSDMVSSEFFFQPGISFRFGLNYKHSEEKNDVSFGDQFSVANDFGTELRYNVAQKGSFQVNVNYIKITFLGAGDQTVLSEMLEGLQPGNNVTMALLYQRNIGKYMQLSLNYSGRKSDDSRMAHLGGAQVRAFF